MLLWVKTVVDTRATYFEDTLFCLGTLSSYLEVYYYTHALLKTGQERC
jgi:hypothetical protein